MNNMKILRIFQKELSVTYNITAKLKAKVTNSSVSALTVGWDFFTMTAGLCDQDVHLHYSSDIENILLYFSFIKM